jgi:hypothetical protein
MAAGPLRTVLEGCFKGMAVGCNCPKSASIVTTVYGVQCIGVITLCYGASSHPLKTRSAVSIFYPVDQRATNASLVSHRERQTLSH